MKKSIKKVMSCLLTTAVVLSVTAHADAKDYYCTKYGEIHSQQTAIVKRMEKEMASSWVTDDQITDNVKADFDGDGKKENIRLSRKYSANYKNANISLAIKGKKQINLNLGEKYCKDYVKFCTVKLGTKVLAVLLYGDNDFAGGGSVIYKWEKNDTLKKLISYKAKGYLDSFVSSDKAKGTKQLYIADSEQLYNRYGSKWPSNVLKKYAKWKNREDTSVTRTSFIKYTIKNDKLKKTGKDVYYSVSNCYD